MTCLALTGCVTDVVTRTEHAELLSSLRALRAENARLEARLDKLEQSRVVAAASRAAPPRPVPPPAVLGAAPAAGSADALPPLTVVRLKPRKETAPALDTAVEVAEPPDASALVAQADDGAPSGDAADLAMADAQFERGLSMMKTGNPEAGIAQMQQFVSDWPRHPRADNALYLSGMAFLADRDYEHAAVQFERALTQYPAGDAVVDSMLKLAECRLKLNRPREARAAFEKIVSSFPGTAAATQAQARLASLSQAPLAAP